MNNTLNMFIVGIVLGMVVVVLMMEYEYRNNGDPKIEIGTFICNSIGLQYGHYDNDIDELYCRPRQKLKQGSNNVSGGVYIKIR